MLKKLLVAGVGVLGAVGIGLPRVKANDSSLLATGGLPPDIPLILQGSVSPYVLACTNTSTAGNEMGIWAETNALTGIAVRGRANHSYGNNVGVQGMVVSPTGKGVVGQGGAYGLYGNSGGVGTYALGTSGKSEFGGDILPTGDGSHNCGGPSNRWRNLYVGAVNTDVLYGTGSFEAGHLKVNGASDFGGSIYPTIDNKFTLGQSNSRWSTISAYSIYADYLHGNLASRSLSKFKESIESPTDIDYLSAIPDPIYFNWKDNDDKKRYLGFMGDQLPTIARDGEGNVYNNSVVAILCGAVQQLKESVKQLKEENEQLRRKIEGN